MDKLETEVKVMDVDPGELRRVLGEMGIELKQRDQRDMVVLLSDSEVVRVRKVNGTTRVTYKHMVCQDDFKVAEETELEVSSPDSAEEILGRLCRGKPCYRFRKEREVFRLNGAKCELVRLDPLPWYVEIEGEEDSIVHAMELLGLRGKPTSSQGLPELLRRSGVLPEEL